MNSGKDAVEQKTVFKAELFDSGDYEIDFGCECFKGSDLDGEFNFSDAMRYALKFRGKGILTEGVAA